MWCVRAWSSGRGTRASADHRTALPPHPPAGCTPPTPTPRIYRAPGCAAGRQAARGPAQTLWAAARAQSERAPGGQRVQRACRCRAALRWRPPPPPSQPTRHIVRSTGEDGVYRKSKLALFARHRHARFLGQLPRAALPKPLAVLQVPPRQRPLPPTVSALAAVVGVAAVGVRRRRERSGTQARAFPPPRSPSTHQHLLALLLRGAGPEEKHAHPHQRPIARCCHRGAAPSSHRRVGVRGASGWREVASLRGPGARNTGLRAPSSPRPTRHPHPALTPHGALSTPLPNSPGPPPHPARCSHRRHGTGEARGGALPAPGRCRGVGGGLRHAGARGHVGRVGGVPP